MSTQGIRSVILRLREEYGDSILPGQSDALRIATDEVEAIERAARNAYAGDVTHRLTASDSGLELGLLMESIARDTL